MTSWCLTLRCRGEISGVCDMALGSRSSDEMTRIRTWSNWSFIYGIPASNSIGSSLQYTAHWTLLQTASSTLHHTHYCPRIDIRTCVYVIQKLYFGSEHQFGFNAISLFLAIELWRQKMELKCPVVEDIRLTTRCHSSPSDENHSLSAIRSLTYRQLLVRLELFVPRLW